MKTLTARPLKMKSGWVKAGEIVDLPKKEAERLATIGAVVSLVTAETVTSGSGDGQDDKPQP